MTIHTVDVHGFFTQNSIGTCPILGGCAEFPGKQKGRMPGRGFRSLLVHAPISPDLIWE